MMLTICKVRKRERKREFKYPRQLIRIISKNYNSRDENIAILKIKMPNTDF